MPANLRRTFFLPLLVIGLGPSCTSHVAKAVESPAALETPPVISAADRQAAQRELDAAANGRKTKDILDDMLRIEAVAPGFAGLFLDKDGSLVAMLANPQNEDRVRCAIDELKARREPGRFNSLAFVKVVRVRPAVFPLSLLIAWQEVLWHHVARVAGVNSIGVDVMSNAVRVGVVDETSTPGVWSVVRELGIPDRAVRIEIHGEIRFLSGSRADLP